MQGNNASSRDEQDNKYFSRRTAIKGIVGATGGVLFPYSAIGGVVANEYSGERVLRRVESGNSLDNEEVREIQKEAISRYQDETGEDISIGNVVPSPQGEVFALSYRIDSTGESSTHIGAVPVGENPDKGRLNRLHRRAEGHAERNRGGVSGEHGGRESSSGTARAGDPTGWDRIAAQYSIDYDDCPKGNLYMAGTIYEKEGPDYWGYGCDHTHRPNPGENYCSSSGYLLRGSHMEHRWGEYDAGTPILHEYYPNSSETGDYSVSGSAGFATASISVSYDPPKTYRNVTADTNDNEAYVVDWDHSEDHDHPVQTNPTSICRSKDRAVSGRFASNRLMELSGTARWRDCSDGWICDGDSSSYSAYIYVD